MWLTSIPLKLKSFSPCRVRPVPWATKTEQQEDKHETGWKSPDGQSSFEAPPDCSEEVPQAGIVQDEDRQ